MRSVAVEDVRGLAALARVQVDVVVEVLVEAGRVLGAAWRGLGLLVGGPGQDLVSSIRTFLK